MREAEARDDSGVPFPPPLLYAVPLFIGIYLHRLYPLATLPAGLSVIVGVVLVALGLLLSSTAIRRFRGAGTAVNPRRPTTAIVDSGPYRFTRNPMYVGLTLLYLGVAAWVNTLWPVIFLPVVLIVIHKVVVEKEERYLERKFGETYHRYRAQVPRWIGWRR